MARESRLEVINREGWQKQYPLTKNLIHIGSDARNDIVLEEKHGGGVAGLHLQLIAAAETGQGYRLVNLGPTDILLGANGERTLPPRATLDLTEGETLKVGDFTLVYQGQSAPAGGGVAGSSQRIGLSLVIPRTQIAPHQSVNGVITVRNLGDQGRVKINLELEGLEPECYHLEPGPMLSSGAEKEVFFSIHHRGHKPLAGSYAIKIHATAPHAYPTEFVTVAQTVEILPFYSHKLRLITPDTAKPKKVAEPSAPAEPIPPAMPKTEPAPQLAPPLSIVPIVEPAVVEATVRAEENGSPKTTSTEDWWAAGAEPEPLPALMVPPPLVVSETVEPPENLPAAVNGDLPHPAAEVIEVEPKELPPVSILQEQGAPALPAETEITVVEAEPPALIVEATPAPLPEMPVPVAEEPVQPDQEPMAPAVEETVEPGVAAEPPIQPEPLETPVSLTPVAIPELEKPAESLAETKAAPPVEVAVKPRRPRAKTSTQNKVKVEPKPAAAPAAEDWWDAEPEAGSAETVKKPAVIKLKATAPAVSPESKPSTTPATQAEDWWDETESG